MKFAVVCFMLMVTAPAIAQYELFKEVNGVQFYTKWGHEKWLSKKSPKVLLVKVVNKGSSAVDFDLGVEFFQNLLMVEESNATSYCLSAGKTLMPRLAGLVFKPVDADPATIDGFDLTGLEIKQRSSASCDKQ